MKKLFLFCICTLYSIIALAAIETAVFASGCFWCAQSDFDKMPGIVSTVVGYAGGQTPNPTYEEVSSGTTNYAESIKITYDNSKTNYAKVLDYFWHHTDPTVADAQFCDHGHQYRSAIFYLNDAQKQQALISKAKIGKQLPNIYTEISKVTTFYPAEGYHQNYYKKNPLRYNFYRLNCGRDARIKEVWHEK
ncbi:MAG TPA: peptide-methionine (S)-S-oxide reductase MsrA [Aquella sp.]|nr:peptide-methionine (S)-S-oxide reductase MsrA [Aquella sp.]